MRKIFLMAIIAFVLCMIAGSNAQAQAKYGHDADGTFWFDKCLSDVANSNQTPQLITAVTDGCLRDMTLEGDRWVYRSGQKTSGIENYCFKVYQSGNNSKFIPDVFYWDKRASSGLVFINQADVVSNGYGGHDFSTSPISW